MGSLTADRPQNNFIAAAVAERMAKMQQTAALKVSSSPSPQPPQQTTSTKRKRSELSRNDVTIDLTDDDEIDTTPTIRNKLPRLDSPQSPVDKQPKTPHQKSPRSPIESPQSPAKMAPGLLHSALNAVSPKSPIESPHSPVEEVTSRKRKLVKLNLAPQNPISGKYSPGSPVEDANSPKKRARRIVESPQSPVEQVNDHTIHAHAAVESPRSPVEETAARNASSGSDVKSPHSPVEEVTAPIQVSSNATATTTTPRGTPPATHPFGHNFSDAATTTTPPGTPPPTQKSTNDLPTSAVADRFAPVTIDGVEYRNPAKFSINPPFWQRWDSKTYVQFAEHLRYHFDPTPFAKETGIPVEELTHVFNAVMCNPLYYPKEAAKRGEEGMTEVMALFQDEKWATIKRPWGKVEGKRWLAELKGVRQGGVELIMGRSGKRNLMGVNLLGKEDVKYLRENLREEEWRVLWS